MGWFKRKSIEQPKAEDPQKNGSERLEDALRSEGNSSNAFREALLNYVKTTNEKIEHYGHEIRRLKIKKDIGEIEEFRKKGFFQEYSMTIRFFQHLYEFVIGEGLAPEKVQKYVSSAKKGLIVLGVVALASVGSSMYSSIAMKRTLEQNRDLITLSQTTKDNTARLREISKSFSNSYAGLSKDMIKLQVDLNQKILNSQKYALNLTESESSNRQFQIASISSYFATNFDAFSNVVSDLRRESSSNTKNITYNSNQISNLLIGVNKISESYGSLDSRLLGLEKTDYGPRMKVFEDKSDKQERRIDIQDKKIDAQDKKIERLKRTD